MLTPTFCAKMNIIESQKNWHYSNYFYPNYFMQNNADYFIGENENSLSSHQMLREITLQYYSFLNELRCVKHKLLQKAHR